MACGKLGRALAPNHGGAVDIINAKQGLDKKILVPKNEDFLSRGYEKDIFVFCIKVSKFHGGGKRNKWYAC